jgi:hypothetical protein
MRQLLHFLLVIALITSCGENSEKADAMILTDQNLVYDNLDQLTKVVVHDVFSPPVSSRIYSYANLAAYEAIRHAKPGYPSFTEKLNGFPPMPIPAQDKSYNHLLASTKAFFTVAKKITFSKDTLEMYEKTVYDKFNKLLPKEQYDSSISFGERVGNAILERTRIDAYKETRGMPKVLGSNDPGKWRPTPPDYLDAAEPHWSKIFPLALDANTNISCPKPPDFDTGRNSVFFKNVLEVYNMSRSLSDSERTIAKYWDDNPFVTEHAGHLMYGNKKITPVGHWIGIATIACKMKQLEAIEAVQTYVLTSIAMHDVIITCWDEKFKSQVIRPITVINDMIDRYWEPYLQTPPFPEHSSGHSGISASAATVLTSKFGNNFAFTDTSDLAYIGMKRDFSSFRQAADEASISRVYGGIHYRSGIEAGIVQGNAVGEFVMNKLLYNNKNISSSISLK